MSHTQWIKAYPSIHLSVHITSSNHQHNSHIYWSTQNQHPSSADISGHVTPTPTVSFIHQPNSLPQTDFINSSPKVIKLQGHIQWFYIHPYSHVHPPSISLSIHPPTHSTDPSQQSPIYNDTPNDLIRTQIYLFIHQSTATHPSDSLIHPQQVSSYTDTPSGRTSTPIVLFPTVRSSRVGAPLLRAAVRGAQGCPR